MVKKNLFQFERANGELDEVIGIIPNWIVKCGISFFLFLLISILWILKYVRYPDIISSSVELVAKEQPYQVTWDPLVSNISYTVNVQENSLVNKNDTLLIEDYLLEKRKKFVLAPFSGRAYFVKSHNNTFKKNSIFLIKETNNYDIVINITADKLGQIKAGQKVLIDLSEYPKSEYGYLEGRIVSIIPIKVNGFYLVYASLANGLNTSKSYSIPNQPAFSGKAEIVIKDLSLFDIIFHL